jgi:hypothetical protein
MGQRHIVAFYDIQCFSRHQEIRVEGGLSLDLLREILTELAKAEGFPTLHALWLFSPGVRPLPFHEFDDVIGLLEKLYAQGPTAKKVALVVPVSFARATAEVFVKQAAGLPIDLRVFSTRSEASDWLGV